MKNKWSRFQRSTNTGLGGFVHVLIRVRSRRRCGVKDIVRNGDVFQPRWEVALGVFSLNVLVEVLSKVQREVVNLTHTFRAAFIPEYFFSQTGQEIFFFCFFIRSSTT